MPEQMERTSNVSTARNVAAASAGDQFLSSLSNFLLVLPVITLSPSAAGLVAVTSAANAITVAALQALLHEPLLIETARKPVRALFSGHAAIAGAMIGVGLASLACAMALGGGDVTIAVCAVAVCVAQDALRFSLIARSRITSCLGGDLVWVVVTAVLLALQWHSLTAREALTSWATGGAISILLLLVVNGRLARGTSPAKDIALFLRSTTGFRLGLLSEMIIGQGVAAVPIIGLTLIGHPGSAALYRLAQSLLGPVGVIVSSTRLWLYPRIVGDGGTRQRILKVERVVLGLGVVLSGLASLGVAIAPLVHLTFASQLSWVLVLLIGLQLSISASYAPSVMSIRVSHGPRVAAKVRLCAGSIQAAGALIGLPWSANAIAACTAASSTINRLYVHRAARKLSIEGQNP